MRSSAGDNPGDRDIIVIGTSAGGLQALRELAAGLPRNFAGCVFAVMHGSASSPRAIAGAIEKSGPLPASYAEDGKPQCPGRIYVAPPDYHLLLDRGLMRLSRGPKENGFRPAVDPLFRSAAAAYGPRVIGIILTGGLDDGTAGLQAIKRLDGLAIVQDPAEAFSPSMPATALRHVRVDYCLPLREIAPLLARLVGTSAGRAKGDFVVPKDIKSEVDIARGKKAFGAGVEEMGQPSPFACPECHGVLLRLDGTKPERFRCHVGHGYSTASLLAEITKRIDENLWSATRSIEEVVLLLRHIADRHDELPESHTAEDLLDQANRWTRTADQIRDAMNSRQPFLIEQQDSED